jgi:hypothetical protein
LVAFLKAHDSPPGLKETIRYPPQGQVAMQLGGLQRRQPFPGGSQAGGHVTVDLLLATSGCASQAVPSAGEITIAGGTEAEVVIDHLQPVYQVYDRLFPDDLVDCGYRCRRYGIHGLRFLSREIAGKSARCRT